MTKGDVRTLVLDGERPVSWNTFYSGKHWTIRNNEAHRVHRLVRSMLDPEIEPFDGAISIKITVYYSGRSMDADNIAAKLYIDGLKGWWFEDDTPEYIRDVTTTCVKSEIPRTEIEITQVGDTWTEKCGCCDRLWPNKKLRKQHEKLMDNPWEEINASSKPAY